MNVLLPIINTFLCDFHPVYVRKLFFFVDVKRLFFCACAFHVIDYTVFVFEEEG